MANCFPPVTASIAVVRPDLPGYPGRLAALDWQPTLYSRGALPPERPAIAIVGARAASGEAMRRAQRLATELAEAGRHIVSGGALGIDGAAHRGALASTVVLGCGVDVAYPKRHAPLFDQILAHGGGLLALLPPGTQPRAGTFVQRNPLIAALADAVVVVEADVRSGSLSTAAAAVKLGRIVCAWPGSPGCDRLIGKGAAIVESTGDVEAALAGAPRRPQLSTDPLVLQLRAAIRAGARDVDALVHATGLSVRTILRTLATMEHTP